MLLLGKTQKKHPGYLLPMVPDLPFPPPPPFNITQSGVKALNEKQRNDPRQLPGLIFLAYHSAVFTGLTNMTKRQNDRQTDHATQCVAVGNYR